MSSTIGPRTATVAALLNKFVIIEHNTTAKLGATHRSEVGLRILYEIGRRQARRIRWQIGYQTGCQM